MYNKIFIWLIAAVNDIYSMSKTRSRVISPALAFQKTIAMFSANFNCKLDKGKCVSPGKTLSRVVCAEVVGNMSVSRQVGACGVLQCPSWLLSVPALLALVQPLTHLQLNSVTVSTISSSDFPSEPLFYLSIDSVFGCFSLSVLSRDTCDSITSLSSP